MTGCHRGIVTRLEQATEFLVLCIWCVWHQINIVIKIADALPQDGQWIKVVYKWCVHVHHQEKLIMDMNDEMCPKKTNQWAHLNNTLKFYILHWCQIVKKTDAHVHLESSSTKWWTIMLAFTLAINEINKTIVQLQNQSDAIPSSLMDSNVNLKWRQQKNKKLGHIL
jgi:hypothetical protein